MPECQKLKLSVRPGWQNVTSWHLLFKGLIALSILSLSLYLRVCLYVCLCLLLYLSTCVYTSMQIPVTLWSTLTTSDYYQFHHLKKHLHGTQFSDSIERQSHVSMDVFYSAAPQSLPENWKKCIELQRDYIDLDGA